MLVDKKFPKFGSFLYFNTGLIKYFQRGKKWKYFKQIVCQEKFLHGEVWWKYFIHFSRMLKEDGVF